MVTPSRCPQTAPDEINPHRIPAHIDLAQRYQRPSPHAILTRSVLSSNTIVNVLVEDINTEQQYYLTSPRRPVYDCSVSSSIEGIYPQLGRRIRQLRVGRQFTQEQLGARLEPPVTRASIANIESGKQRLLVHTLLQLAHLFEVSVEELLPAPSTATGSPVAAIATELRRKLRLPAGAATLLAQKVDPPAQTPTRRSGRMGTPTRRAR